LPYLESKVSGHEIEPRARGFSVQHCIKGNFIRKLNCS